jgi:CRISPR-associated protein Cas1
LDKNTDFNQISSLEWLQKGWDSVRINNGAPGGDGQTVEKFEKNSASRIIGISRKLREGNYRPGELRRAYIPKKNGELRPLDIPCVADRIIQSSVAQYLQPVFEAEFEDNSFAYRPGRGVLDAVQRIGQYRRQGFTHVVDADIRHFFERVAHDPLIYKLEELISDRKLVDLIWTWLEWYNPSGRGLPQGSPLSPALANLYLDNVDEALDGHGLRLVRYADDFVILAKSEKKARSALAKARQILLEAGLEINEDKTRIVSFNRGFQFLGHVFMRSLVFRNVMSDDIPQEDALSAIQEQLKSDEEAERAKLLQFDDDPMAAMTDLQPKDLSFSRRWRTLYVLEPGRTLSSAGEAFTVMEDKARLLGLPANKVGRIELGAAVLIDTSALDLASLHDVPIVRLDGFGTPTGIWQSPRMNHAERHIAQFRASESEVGLETAREIVMARIWNQRILLKRLDRKKPIDQLSEASVRFKRILRRVQFDDDIPTMMGREGEAAAIYWRLLSSYLPEKWRFPSRSRNPASGCAEVALNVVSHLLARDISIAVKRRGLHPGIGVLHRPRDDGEALVYDLMEEFRAPIAEASVVAAIGRETLSLDMFNRSNLTGWSVNRDGYRALVKAYETTANRNLRDPIDKTQTTWRGLMELSAERFALACEGSEKYHAYRMDY